MLKQMFLAAHENLRSCQVGEQVGEPALSAYAHAHALHGDSAAATNCPYVSHGAEEPGVHFDQDLRPRPKVELRRSFDAFDATSA
jgi:hypothetical protein